jgi:hypothetical protein
MKYSGDVLACVAVAILLYQICYAGYYSFKEDGRRLLLRDYLRLQIFKVGILYFIFYLIILGYGGWKLEIENWARSLFGLFVLSILIGYASPPDNNVS